MDSDTASSVIIHKKKKKKIYNLEKPVAKSKVENYILYTGSEHRMFCVVVNGRKFLYKTFNGAVVRFNRGLGAGNACDLFISDSDADLKKRIYSSGPNPGLIQINESNWANTRVFEDGAILYWKD